MLNKRQETILCSTTKSLHNRQQGGDPFSSLLSFEEEDPLLMQALVNLGDRRMLDIDKFFLRRWTMDSETQRRGKFCIALNKYKFIYTYAIFRFQGTYPQIERIRKGTLETLSPSRWEFCWSLGYLAG